MNVETLHATPRHCQEINLSVFYATEKRYRKMRSPPALRLSISDASWSKFVTMLEYKALWHNRVVQKVGTFYPSSQTCPHCDFIKPLVEDL